jgi:hypothetical protein
VVLENVATLQEIETHWSIDDLADANDVLSYRAALQASEQKKQSKK